MSRAEKTRAMILRLKEFKEENGLSVAEIHDKVEAKGFTLSDSSVRRVFEKGSEDKSFRYEDTIQPIVTALFDTDKPTQEVSGAVESEAEALRQLVQLKNVIIEENKAEAQKKIDFLKEQIAAKDTQLQNKDEQLKHRAYAMQERWQMIERLNSQLDAQKRALFLYRFIMVVLALLAMVGFSTDSLFNWF